jgi:type II secretory pathway component PulK
MTVFVIALATILVLDFADDTLRYQRQARLYQERMQADFVVKSLITLGEVVILIPNPDGFREDSLLDPWHLFGSEQNIPVYNFEGESRIAIVDETSKLNINLLGAAGSQSNAWMDTFVNLFAELGFADETFTEGNRTLGDKAFEASDQAAVISDWLDNDKRSFSAPGYGQGIESSAPKEWFYNRPFTSFSELALVPGMTMERVNRIAPYVNVRAGGSSDARINMNTASEPVLRALGFAETEVTDITTDRINSNPIPEATKNQYVQLLASKPEQGRALAVQSNEFSVFVRVKTSNVTRWGKATFQVNGRRPRIQLKRVSLELM